jgi:tRNA-guanine family transglycosylase
LIKEKEMLWWILISLHNIAYLHQLVEKIRQDILS